MREVFVMLTKKKVIFVINMQKFITSNIRHFQIKKIITLLCTNDALSLVFFRSITARHFPLNSRSFSCALHSNDSF